MRAAPAHEISTWLWTRQAGKSLVAAYLTLWLLFRAPRQLVLVASGSGGLGAKRLLRTVRDVAARSSLLSGSVLDESGHVLAISTGSEARAIPTNEAAARGWAANAVIADEAQSLPPEFLLSALLPTLAAREGAFALAVRDGGPNGRPVLRPVAPCRDRGERHVLREAGEPGWWAAGSRCRGSRRA